MFGFTNQKFSAALGAVSILLICVLSSPVSAQQYQVPSDPAPVDNALRKLDVIIPVFDPNLQTKGELDVWPEVRRAEAIRFAHLAKQALDKTGVFGAVRVTPDDSIFGELYVFGKIIEANGEDVTVEFTVNDIRSRKTTKDWMRKEKFSHRVQASFFATSRNDGTDAYAPVFDKFASALAKKLKKINKRTRNRIKSTSEMLFANSLSSDKFGEFIRFKGRGENVRVELRGLPDDSDEIYQRIRTLRILEQQYTDQFQANYEAYFQDSNKDYFAWQKAAYPLIRELREEKAALDARLARLAVEIGACQLFNKCSPKLIKNRDGLIEQIAEAIREYNEKKRELKENFAGAQVLNEMGQALNFELEDRNIAIENVSVDLKGSTLDHFRSYKEFIKKLYEEDVTPDIQL